MINSQGNDSREIKRKDSRELWDLYKGVQYSIFPKIIEVINTHQAWETLEKPYKGKNKVKNVKLHILKKKFETL